MARRAKAVVARAFPHLGKHSQRYIELSPFFYVGSTKVGGMGDVSLRGGEAGFVLAFASANIALPDRPCNNRLDTLTNIVGHFAVGMLFFLSESWTCCT
jgi:hypothetical protein